MAFGKDSTTRNVNFTNTNEIEGWFRPYTMMGVGAAVVFGFVAIMRIAMWINLYFFHNLPATNFWTWGLTVCGIIACVFVYKFYHRRGEQGNEVLIRFHPTVSTALGFIWMILAFNDQPNAWMFSQVSLGLFILGGGLVAFTWMARRWSFKSFQPAEPKTNEWELLGFGETSAMGNVPVPGGRKIKLKLDPKVTTSDLLDKITLIAKKFKTSYKKIRIQEDLEDPNFAYVTVMEQEPFAEAVLWKGPDKPGTSIAEPIEFATYDTGERANLYLSGKDGESCFSWLTTGMPGTGKTYAWQVIYGSVLARKEVSLVWIDASKDYASAMPLLSGIEWFAGSLEYAHKVIANVDRSIESRMKYLASKGYQYWKPGCGINFIILHVEEASDFLDTESEKVLKHISRAGRSAGVIVIYSLQRATNDNMPTSLRNNLEGKMAFKVGKKSERQFCLSDKQLGAGAAPETIAVNGGFYFDSRYEPSELAGNMVRGDKMDELELERSVDMSAGFRTPLDNVTASAFGQPYEKYRAEVMNNATEWQKVRMNRGSHNSESMKTGYENMNDDTAEYEKYEKPVKSNRSQNLNSDPAAEAEKLWNFIVTMDFEKFTKSEIYKPYMAATGKSKSWICSQIDKWENDGKIANEGSGKYSIK